MRSWCLDSALNQSQFWPEDLFFRSGPGSILKVLLKDHLHVLLALNSTTLFVSLVLFLVHILCRVGTQIRCSSLLSCSFASVWCGLHWTYSEFASVKFEGDRLLPLYIQDFSTHSVWSCRCEAYVTSQHAGLQNRDGACVDGQTSWHPLYFDPNGGSALLQCERNQSFQGSIIRGVEVVVTAFVRTSYSFPWFFPELLLGLSYSPWNANALNVYSGSFFQVRLKDCGFSFIW